MEDIDLFENYNDMPSNLMAVIEKYDNTDGLSYNECAAMLIDVEAIGYTFEYGLDGIPYDLKKCEVTP